MDSTIPDYEFCSTACQTIAFSFLDEKGVIDPKRLSQMETLAVKEARQQFADCLTELGLMPAFHDRTAKDIDRVIEACVTGFRLSMWRQSNQGEIPF